MKFNLFVLPTIPATFEEREKLRPIGRNNDKYQAMLTELREIAQLAEELGFDAMSTTEHHFHSEGYEASIAPLLLYTEGYSLGAETQGAGFIQYFAGFGFFEAYRYPGETTPVPWKFERMVEAKYSLVGTVDDVKREMEALRKNTNIEWFCWFFDQGMMPWEETKRQLEIFGTKILPEFKD